MSARRVGRPRNAMPSAVWKVCIPLDLAAQIELLLHDPLRHKVTYGSRGQLIESALREWLASKGEDVKPTAAGENDSLRSELDVAKQTIKGLRTALQVLGQRNRQLAIIAKSPPSDGDTRVLDTLPENGHNLPHGEL